MALNVNDRVKVIFSMWMDGQLGLNIRHYRVTAVGGVGLTEDQAAEAMFLVAAPIYALLISDQAVVVGVSVRDLTDVAGLAAGVSTSPEVDGEVLGDPLPAQCCGLIKLRTNLAGRANRGRAYIPFPGETDSGDDHIPTPGYMTNLETLGAFFLDDRTLTIGVDSVTFRPIIKHVGPGDVDVTGYTARPAWATQRRRGSFGAANPKTIAV